MREIINKVYSNFAVFIFTGGLVAMDSKKKKKQNIDQTQNKNI